MTDMRIQKATVTVSQAWQPGMPLYAIEWRLKPHWTQPVPFRRRLWAARRHPRLMRKRGEAILGKFAWRKQ